MIGWVQKEPNMYICNFVLIWYISLCLKIQNVMSIGDIDLEELFTKSFYAIQYFF